jgi:hypothetical protein
MHYKRLLILIVAIVLFSCKKETANPELPPPNNPAPKVLLKDIVVSRLPAPYYHFEYDANGNINFVSFASDFTRYDVFYNNDRISGMRTNILVNKDRLQYSYDNQGRVFLIQIADSTGVVFAKSFFTYDGKRLIKTERLHKVAAGFILDRTLTMTYASDGNLQELSDHRPAIEGQNESTLIHQYEQYDDKTNVDGFSLLHPDFFEHLLLLPGVKLQINNPGKETITGDGIHLKTEYVYTYNDKNLPLLKTSTITLTNGADSGMIVHGTTTYSYYK